MAVISKPSAEEEISSQIQPLIIENFVVRAKEKTQRQLREEQQEREARNGETIITNEN